MVTGPTASQEPKEPLGDESPGRPSMEAQKTPLVIWLWKSGDLTRETGDSTWEDGDLTWEDGDSAWEIGDLTSKTYFETCDLTGEIAI